jgi:hypothetical protein
MMNSHLGCSTGSVRETNNANIKLNGLQQFVGAIVLGHV